MPVLGIIQSAGPDERRFIRVLDIGTHSFRVITHNFSACDHFLNTRVVPDCLEKVPHPITSLIGIASTR